MNPTLDRSTPIGDVAASMPRAIPVFERYRIDYCCGGHRSLAEAAERAGADFDDLLAALTADAAAPAERDWRGAPIGELLDHILETHHEYTKQAMVTLDRLGAKVLAAHGRNHPEVGTVRRLSGALFNELEQHLAKEEEILFPMLRALASGSTNSPNGAGPCGPEMPMRVMEMEHDHAGKLLAEVRRVSGEFQAPEDACTSYRAWYAGLEELEADLHRHIHLENNVLHPRARALCD